MLGIPSIGPVFRWRGFLELFSSVSGFGMPFSMARFKSSFRLFSKWACISMARFRSHSICPWNRMPLHDTISKLLCLCQLDIHIHGKRRIFVLMFSDSCDQQLSVINNYVKLYIKFSVNNAYI